MRCSCCNAILHRVTGMNTPDGSKIDETFCNTCRNEVNKVLGIPPPILLNINLEGIVDQLMIYGCVTPSKKSVY